MKHQSGYVPPLFQPADPNAARVDVDRLAGQNLTIYKMLKERPRTNVELAAVTARYSARVHDLRKSGIGILTRPANDGTGLVAYSLVA